MRSYLRIAACGGLVLFSQALYALGLGNAEVHSYLNEPLNARIALINATPDELNTITASLASAADMERLGLSRSVSVPLHFRVGTDPVDAYIEVTSRLPINDPVVQMVVQLRWGGGRMLREYTLFIDPPTLAVRPPAPAVAIRQPAPPVVQDDYPDPANLDVVETIKPQPQERVQTPAGAAPAMIAQTPSGDATSPETTPATVPDATEQTLLDGQQGQAASPQTSAATVPADHLVDAPEEVETAPNALAESLPGEPAPDRSTESLPGDPAPDVTLDPQPTVEDTQPSPDEEVEETGPPDAGQLAEQAEELATQPAPSDLESIESQLSDEYGPVQRGETLWGIATAYTRGTEYSVNQAMLAIQRLNPDAFGGNNINALHRGAILRLPTHAEVERLTPRQAMLEAVRQEQAYQAMRAGSPYDASPPLIADAALEGAAVEPAVNSDTPASEPEQAPRLVLVPPSDGEPSAGGNGAGETQATGAMSSEELEEILARTEEELANAQQENTYLSERIRELEDRLAASDSDGLVRDEGMAALESGLREDRLSNADEAEAGTAEPSSLVGKAAWLVPLLVVIVGLGVWLLRRMGGAAEAGTHGGSEGAGEAELQAVGGIRSAAEELLKTLEGDEPDEPGRRKVSELEGGASPGTTRAKPEDDTEVVELDTSDPETQLDLARAYISMGDPEAARSMLESVLEHGNEAQVTEARGMMKEL